MNVSITKYTIVTGFEVSGSPDLDLAMAVEMSQLYTKKEEKKEKEDQEKINNEEEEISMAIELSLIFLFWKP